MKPFIHAKKSVEKLGGSTADYIDIHEFIDSSKSALPEHRHRAILHSSFGTFIVEKAFGSVRTNSDGVEYSTREIAEDHIYEDLGFIPTVEHWLSGLPILPWMGGSEREENKENKVNSPSVPVATTPGLDIDWWKKNYLQYPVPNWTPNTHPYYDRVIVTD